MNVLNARLRSQMRRLEQTVRRELSIYFNQLNKHHILILPISLSRRDPDQGPERGARDRRQLERVLRARRLY
jgi:hypothetical protein